MKPANAKDAHMTDQTQKFAIVTGGSRGLGRNTVLNLARRGVDAIFTYNSNRAAADEVVGLVEEAGRRALAVQLDTGDVSAFDAFAGRVRQTLGGWGAERFDYLVNNAGISHHNSIESTTEAELDAVYNVHFKGVFFLTQKLLPLIADGGRILNMSSGLARFTLPGFAAYASTKGAIEVLTRYLAKELGPRQIRVNVVAPGAIATDFAGGRIRDNAAVNDAIAASIPLGRVGLPDDVGGAVAAMLSDGFSWVNGTRIEVSGGQNV